MEPTPRETTGLPKNSKKIPTVAAEFKSSSKSADDKVLFSV